MGECEVFPMQTSIPQIKRDITTYQVRGCDGWFRGGFFFVVFLFAGDDFERTERFDVCRLCESCHLPDVPAADRAASFADVKMPHDDDVPDDGLADLAARYAASGFFEKSRLCFSDKAGSLIVSATSNNLFINFFPQALKVNKFHVCLKRTSHARGEPRIESGLESSKNRFNLGQNSHSNCPNTTERDHARPRTHVSKPSRFLRFPTERQR